MEVILKGGGGGGKAGLIPNERALWGDGVKQTLSPRKDYRKERQCGLARKSRSRKAILRLNALLTGLRFTSEREKCFMLKFLRYHNARVLRETRPCTGIGGLSVAASHPLLIL